MSLSFLHSTALEDFYIHGSWKAIGITTDIYIMVFLLFTLYNMKNVWKETFTAQLQCLLVNAFSLWSEFSNFRFGGWLQDPGTKRKICYQVDRWICELVPLSSLHLHSASDKNYLCMIFMSYVVVCYAATVWFIIFMKSNLFFWTIIYNKQNISTQKCWSASNILCCWVRSRWSVASCFSSFP